LPTSDQYKVTALRLAAIAVACLLSDGAQAQQVGTAAAVNPSAQVRGTAGSRTVVIGQSIVHRERIQTTSAGSVQLLFLDKTSMTIGPNSDLAIDEYVYDPNSNSGRLAATLTKGVMRFVGGQISHAGNAQITTPGATVGIRGGVGIFSPQSVYIGYGEGTVRSGSTSVTVTAGEWTQTLGGGTPPTNPSPPPAGYLSSVLSTLQSQPGQGGGAPTTAGAINQARVAATGTPNGSISTVAAPAATNPPPVTNTTSTTTQTIQTTTNQSRATQLVTERTQTRTTTQTSTETQTQTQTQTQTVPSPGTPQPPLGVEVSPQQQRLQATRENLTGYTAGLTYVSNSQANSGGTTSILTGTATYQTDPQNGRAQANFNFSNGELQFGSTDANLGANSTTTNGYDTISGTETALLPAVDNQGKPISHSNGGVKLAQQDGFLVQFQPGSALTRSAQAAFGGAAFCDCEYTRWGFWRADIKHGVGNLREQIDSFWVAGRLPEAKDVPTTGIATYVGHAAAQINNNSQSYAASGRFENVVNFGQRTGQVTVTNLDQRNYAGTVNFANDPRYFAGVATSTNQANYMSLYGNFFNGRTSAVGEMGGAFYLSGTNYTGAGIFAGRRQ
jgi:hypothetical protein